MRAQPEAHWGEFDHVEEAVGELVVADSVAVVSLVHKYDGARIEPVKLGQRSRGISHLPRT